MNNILSTLDDIARDPFTWDQHAANPVAALTDRGLDPARANEILSALRREPAHQRDGSWQSCDACIDPGSDPDPFEASTR
jgi:hypothetical protein